MESVHAGSRPFPGIALFAKSLFNDWLGLMKRYLRLGLGSLLIMVGFIGLFVPVVQGLLLIGIGTALLSKESERVRMIVERIKKRWTAGRKAARAKPE